MLCSRKGDEAELRNECLACQHNRISRWPEPVEVKYAEDLGTSVCIVGATLRLRTHVDQLLSKDKLAELRYEKMGTPFAADLRRVFVAGRECTRERINPMRDRGCFLNDTP